MQNFAKYAICYIYLASVTKYACEGQYLTVTGCTDGEVLDIISFKYGVYHSPCSDSVDDTRIPDGCLVDASLAKQIVTREYVLMVSDIFCIFALMLIFRYILELF